MTLKRATSVAFFILTASLTILALGHTSLGLASDAVYKCGDTFTNDAAQAKREKCQLLEGGAVVTIPSASQQKAVTVTKPKTQKITQTAPLRSAAQQARDHDSKAIIQSELKKTEAHLIDLRRQYAGLSSQQDLQLKLEVKQKIARAEADVVSLKRELER